MFPQLALLNKKWNSLCNSLWQVGNLSVSGISQGTFPHPWSFQNNRSSYQVGESVPHLKYSSSQCQPGPLQKTHNTSQPVMQGVPHNMLTTLTVGRYGPAPSPILCLTSWCQVLLLT